MKAGISIIPVAAAMTVGGLPRTLVQVECYFYTVIIFLFSLFFLNPKEKSVACDSKCEELGPCKHC